VVGGGVSVRPLQSVFLKIPDVQDSKKPVRGPDPCPSETARSHRYVGLSAAVRWRTIDPDSSSDDRASQFDRRVGPRRGSPRTTRSHDPGCAVFQWGRCAEVAAGRSWRGPGTSTFLIPAPRPVRPGGRARGSKSGGKREVSPASSETWSRLRTRSRYMRFATCRADASWVKGARDSERRPDPARHQDRDHDDRRSRNR
jgi:hypothetical protein